VALNELAVVALQETTGWLEYLQSPEALRNARRAREHRIATRNQRRSRTPNPESGTSNTEPQTPNAEPGTPNPEPGTEPEHEPRSENSEA